jgi:hypothetical protein
MKLIWQLLVASLVVVSFTSCRKSHEELTPVVVHGQVFLVLKSGNAVKLALASVNVLPESEAVSAAEAAQKQCESILGVVKTDLSQEISTLTTQLAAKRESLRKKQQQLVAETEAMKERRDFSETYTSKVAEISSIDSELARNDGLKEKTDALRKDREGALRSFPNEFAEALIAVAKPTSVTHTNADGEFTLEIPKHQGRVALLIEASRELEGVERFVWFVWLDRLTADSGVYLFSNHNVLSSGTEANVVNVSAEPPES